MAHENEDLSKINDRHILKSDQNTTMYGIGAVGEVELIKQLVYDLNFTTSWVKSEDNSYGVYNKERKTWNGVIQMLIQDQADLSSAHLTITSARSSVVSFTEGFDRTRCGLFMAKRSVVSSWLTFMEVFTSRYWCVLVATISLISFTLVFFIGYKVSNQNFTTVKMFADILSSTSIVLLSLATLDLLIHKLERLYSSNSFKMIIFVISLFGWFNKTAYDGGLVSYLISPHYASKINTIEDLITYPEYQLVLRHGTAGIEYFSASETWPQKVIWDEKLNNNKESFVNGISDAETLLLGDNTKIYFDLLNEVEPLFESYPCDIVRAQQTYFHRVFALAFKKNSQYVDLFSHQIRRYLESGVTENMASLKRYPKGTVTCPSENFLSIGYEVVFSAFVVSGLGILVAVVQLVIEIILIKCHGNYSH
jgi:hypothetical protein